MTPTPLSALEGEGGPELPTTHGVVEFLTGAVENPHRAGTPLRGDLAGNFAARRGSYRLLYRINDVEREVVVLRIEHRRDAYRPR